MKMNILHTVQSYPPAEGGMAEVVKQLSERLAALGHNVTVATECHPGRLTSRRNGVNVVSFAVSGNMVNGLHGDVAAYRQYLLESRFDVIVNFAAQQWATDIALPLLPLITARKVFVPTGFSCLMSKRYKKYFARMPEWMACYDMNVFHSDSYRDITFARQHGISKTMLIPNGAAADEFLCVQPAPDIRSRLNIPLDHFMVLHVGSHTGLKGHDEAISIFEKADIRDSTLLIVGNDPPGGCGGRCQARAESLNGGVQFKSSGKQIIVATLSRIDTVSAYHSADLFLFPSNIECSPVVLFECMASRTPFLVTDAGNSSEIIKWSGGAGVLLPSAPVEFCPGHGSLTERFVEKLRVMLGRSEDYCAVRADISGSVALLESLSHDKVKLDLMAQSGMNAWQEHFTWEKLAGKYEELYNGLITSKI